MLLSKILGVQQVRARTHDHRPAVALQTTTEQLKAAALLTQDSKAAVAASSLVSNQALHDQA